ncbi:MAG: DUF1905 domain-containing protein [Fimbriimonadia bacterium]|nr:DUF1905 domain-containing protein [Fimbriimonadia bacterium]
MNKAIDTSEIRQSEVIRFETQLYAVSGKSPTDTHVMLEMPPWVSEKFPSQEKIRIEGTINGHPFRATTELREQGTHSLRVNSAMLKGSRANVGDTVSLVILGPEPRLVVPSDLLDALNKSPDSKKGWDRLTDADRRDWTRWIELAKKPETRMRRISRAVDQLSSGKRRACCVNVYDFMLCRFKEDEES